MRRCPTCTRTFLDDDLKYCTDDGAPLVDQPQYSSFDPGATVVSPTPPNTQDVPAPPPTRPFRPDDMPGGWPKPHAWADSEPLPPAPPAIPSWQPQTSSPSAWTPPPSPGARFSAKKSQQNPLAIASLALGIFSMTIGLCCYVGIGTGPVAVILGVIAMTQIKNNSSQAAAGKGMAVAGIVTGGAAIAIGMLLLFFRLALH